MLLDNTPEYDLIWDKVYERLNFFPSINKSAIPFQIKDRYAIYSCDKITELQVDMMENEICNIFSDISDGSKMYALDWMHSAFLYDPKNIEEQKSFWKEDDKYLGGGYNAYFPSFFPDGDYYFFIDEHFRFGYLGHPWRQEIWVWGEELIDRMDEICGIIGLNKIK